LGKSITQRHKSTKEGAWLVKCAESFVSLRLCERSSFAFFLVFILNFSSCAVAEQRLSSDFYEGLRKGQEEATTAAIACFEKALYADNPHIASAAAAELMSLRFAGAELSAAAMDGIRQKVTGSWAAALDAVDESGVVDKEKFLALLLDGDSRSLDEAAFYALEKGRPIAAADTADGNPFTDIFTETESAAINGRIAASRSRYNEALIFFRIALHDSPDLFFRYSHLLNDLGRTFQYTSTGREGIDLFLKWEKSLDDVNFSHGIIPAGSENFVRFRLLFFAARIARQRGEDTAPSALPIALFEQALPYAWAAMSGLDDSPEQADACIWYILDSSLAQGPDATIRYLEKYISRWHDAAYFSDVLDKLARELVHQQRWEDIASVCTILQSRPGMAAGAVAHYAWIISRAIEEGLFLTEKFAAEYKRIAYDAGGSSAAVGRGAAVGGVWYYRSLSAAALGEPFLVLTEEEAAEIALEAEKPLMQFLLGFFEHDAAQFAPRYIRPVENDLSEGELRRLAEALGAAGQYQESMRLVLLYARKNGYRMVRQDLELLYPRPYQELVEHYAGETGIEPSLLYGLIRTESAFDSAVVSRAGAIGLTQLMPATAHEAAARLHRRGGPDYTRADTATIDLYDPAVNIHIGAAYLAYLEERMEDPLLALLAYNGGMTRIRRWRRAANPASGSSSRLPPSGPSVWPTDLFLETVEYPETRNYGRNVMAAAAMYQELYYQGGDVAFSPSFIHN